MNGNPLKYYTVIVVGGEEYEISDSRVIRSVRHPNQVVLMLTEFPSIGRARGARFSLLFEAMRDGYCRESRGLQSQRYFGS
jgi:hypothetical protein